MPASFKKRLKGGAPTAASALARRSTSSSGLMASAARPAPDSSRSSKESGIRLVRSFRATESLPHNSSDASLVIIWMSTGPYSKVLPCRLRCNARYSAGAARTASPATAAKRSTTATEGTPGSAPPPPPRPTSARASEAKASKGRPAPLRRPPSTAVATRAAAAADAVAMVSAVAGEMGSGASAPMNSRPALAFYIAMYVFPAMC
mmetsp:Transcript_98950/g.284280  ORF Transcript_98950/g.284280 Transcript_98950/m.284280 type:complete len:205 (+) Transcript_98950:1039-1653(+)